MTYYRPPVPDFGGRVPLPPRDLRPCYLYYTTNWRDLSDSTSEVTTVWRSANTIIIF